MDYNFHIKIFSILLYVSGIYNLTISMGDIFVPAHSKTVREIVCSRRLDHPPSHRNQSSSRSPNSTYSAVLINYGLKKFVLLESPCTL